MQFKQRVLEVADEVAVVASRSDESCAMVSSLTEELQQRTREQGTLQDVVVIVRSTT